MLGSITPPHSAEFLLSLNHPQFANISGFEGRGVVLVFRWEGPHENVLESKIWNDKELKPEILYHVHFGNFSGKSYWHSRIVPNTSKGLILTKAVLRESPIPEEFCKDVIKHDLVDEEYINRANEIIGTGIEVYVPGCNPFNVPEFWTKTYSIDDFLKKSSLNPLPKLIKLFKK